MTICVPPNKIRVIREIRVQNPYASHFTWQSVFPFHLTILFLQKKCQILKKGSLRASSGKYLTKRISLYSRCRLCPRAECPNQFRLSYCPKLPASSTSFSTSLPRFTSGGTMSLLSSSPNTSFMIYITAPANSHSPNRLSSSCKSRLSTPSAFPPILSAIFVL